MEPIRLIINVWLVLAVILLARWLYLLGKYLQARLAVAKEQKL